MEYCTLILLGLVSLLIFSRIDAVGEELEAVPTELNKMSLHQAISTLEEVVKEENVVEEFCSRHFDIGRKPVNEEKLCDRKPYDCADLFNGGINSSGVYAIDAAFDFSFMKQIRVYCDMETDGGGWTVFQRRGPFQFEQNFFRSWKEYANGFGNLEEEFWLGNDNIHGLTEQNRVTLRIDLEDFEGNKRQATYTGFNVRSSEQNYEIYYGDYSGDAGDSLTYKHAGKSFTTYDRNNRNKRSYCYEDITGGWWYADCSAANLNGKYNYTASKNGIYWFEWLGYEYSLKKTEMKLRKEDFDPHRVINLC